MKTHIIGPHELDAGAVVPQCLDVHFVSDAVLSRMLREGRDYRDPTIVALRQRETFVEYRRSLLFARQSVINRAFFTNPLVYADFQEGFSNEPARLAFRELVEAGAIVPFLLTNSNFFDDVEQLSNLGEAQIALNSLKSLFDDLRCVRLAVNDGENERASQALDQMFRAFVAALGEVRRAPAHINALAAEVFRNQELSHDELKGFGQALVSIAQFAMDSHTLNRTVLYEHFLTNGAHAFGRFKSLSENPFMLAQKKILDLRYNTALPDMLQRFALTPRGLPTHAAVDHVVPSGRARFDSGEGLLTSITDRLLVDAMSNAQTAYYLPHLSELTITDVAHLRSLPEWKNFAEAQRHLLENPTDPVSHIAGVFHELENFQRRFSRWYYDTHPDAKPLKRYKARVTIILNVLGVTLAVLSSDPSVVEKIALNAIPFIIPEKVKGFVARQLVDFFDPETREVDREYSYSIDLLRSGLELSKSDVVGLFKSFGVLPSDEANAGAPD